MSPCSSQWMLRVVALVLLTGSVFADNDVARRSRGDLLKAHQYETFGAYALFVDPTGNDANACTSTGTGACLTIQGALDKAPKQLRHQLVVTAAAGNYGGFYISGFRVDESLQHSTVGITVQGAIANSTTLASGTASGTASSGTAGADVTFGTLTDLTQNWTVNDLKGRLLARTGGTGTLANFNWVISSNTATTLTVVGNQTAVDATSVYAIQDATTVITGTVPEITSSGVVFSNSKIVVTENVVRSAFVTTVTLRNLRVPMTVPGSGVVARGSTSIFMSNLQVLESSGSSSLLDCAEAGSACEMDSCYLKSNGITTGSGAAVSSGSPFANIRLRYTLITDAHEGVTTISPLAMIECEVTNADHPIRVYPPGWLTRNEFIGNRLSGTQAQGNPCLSFSDHESLSGTGTSTVTSVNVSNCVTGIRIVGGTVVVNAMSGTLTGTGILAEGGGRAYVAPAGYTLSATTDLAIDNTAATSTFAALVPAGCFSGLGSSSKVCSQ